MYKALIRTRVQKYLSIGTRDRLSHWLLKREGGRDLATSRRNLAGSLIYLGSLARRGLKRPIVKS